MIVKNSIIIKQEWVKSRLDYSKLKKAIGEFDPSATYGGAGFWGDKLTPDTMYLLDCSGIFYCHDGRFEIGGKEQEFFIANSKMYDELVEWINLRNWWPWGMNWACRRLAVRRAKKYHWAVCTFGSKSFNWKNGK